MRVPSLATHRRQYSLKHGVIIGVLLLLACGLLQARSHAMEWVQVSENHRSFVYESSARRFVPWGFNYDRDDQGRLIEDYWEKEWPTIEEDFREMKDLGANVVRVHLQLGRFMRDAKLPNEESLQRLDRLVALAERLNIYLDLTGLGCYHKQDVPAWYDPLAEPERWSVQARFWQAIARRCAASPAVFCYDLMNEPIGGGGEGKKDWLPGKPLGGKYFVQRITLDLRGRTEREVARAWVERLTSAIRSVNERHLITVGVIPWAQVFKGARPLFYAPEVRGPLDFVSVHFYPKAGKIQDDLTALKVYDVGKPVVIEETFPLSCSIAEFERFIEGSRGVASGWIGFYWGKPLEELRASKTIADAMTRGWLEFFQRRRRKSSASF